MGRNAPIKTKQARMVFLNNQSMPRKKLENEKSLSAKNNSLF